MTERKHTPGPWTLARVDEESGLIGWWITGPKAEHICNVYDVPDDPDAAGNAQLIARAPDLLDDLSRAEARYEQRGKLLTLAKAELETKLEAVQARNEAEDALRRVTQDKNLVTSRVEELEAALANAHREGAEWAAGWLKEKHALPDDSPVVVNMLAHCPFPRTDVGDKDGDQ